MTIELKMSKWILVILSIFIFMQILVVNSEDVEINNKCTYSANKRILNCVGLENMNKNLALFITAGTQMLFIRNSRNVVFQINHHAHPNYANLISYQILNSQYFLPSQGAFLGLPNVQYMEIHGNVWQEIADNTFLGLRGLEVLNIASNHIKKLNTYSFNHLIKLKNLDLSQNSLEIIPSYVFENLNELEALYINNNFVKTIKENAFLELPHLSMLFLTNNSLEYIIATEFNKLKNLEHLNINFNKIKSVEGQFTLPGLKFLQISNNELRHLENNIFEQCPNLLSVDLSRNNLKDLTENPFLNLSKLRHLNLYNNFVDLSTFTVLKINTTIIHN